MSLYLFSLVSFEQPSATRNVWKCVEVPDDFDVTGYELFTLDALPDADRSAVKIADVVTIRSDANIEAALQRIGVPRVH